jgi:hypothetical protein
MYVSLSVFVGIIWNRLKYSALTYVYDLARRLRFSVTQVTLTGTGTHLALVGLGEVSSDLGDLTNKRGL